ncbi:MAG: fimh-like protein [Candidatus Magnetoglobus multicellularis str. Araruama]|uniref:Fimh-like protein n=1 Tax=Candidatus Magnetoglobus multicellularis str. Araruama TaxID=890399 RepID=A0A1V1P0D0_9BACT|nr:MAG: fimh-like protein [Candidatus Magnetoglobus multicellularis str. Araruama]
MYKQIYLFIILLILSTHSVLAQLVDNGNGTITDKSTCLIWQKNASNKTMAWNQALSYCENLRLSGKSDWRLPNLEELRSIVDYSKYNPAIDEAIFP